MRSDMKYVVFDGYNGEQIIIFPRNIQHSCFAGSITKLSFGTMHPISGGFVVDGECVGESESLRMVSRGELDTALINDMLNKKQLDVKPVTTVYWGEATPIVSKPTFNRNKAKRNRKKRGY